MRAQSASLSLACRTLGVSQAGFYKGQQDSARTHPRQEPCDERLAQRIRTILDREETFGCRRILAWLRFQEGVVVNRKTVHRIMTARQHSALGYLTPRVWRDQFYQLPQAA